MTQLSKYEAMIVKSGSKLTKQRKQILKVTLRSPGSLEAKASAKSAMA